MRTEIQQEMMNYLVLPHIKELQLTTNPLRDLSAAEFGRYVALKLWSLET